MTPSEPSSPLEGIPSRLPLAALGVWVMRSLIGLIPAALIFLVGQVPVRLIIVLVLAFQVTHVVTWLRFSWRLDASALIIERGLLMRERRVIPRDRVQSVDLERTLVHRILGVTEVRVEAIGAQDTEGALPALQPAVAEALREALLGTSDADEGFPMEGAASAPSSGDETIDGEAPFAAGPPRPSRAPEIIARMSGRDLLVAGITGGRVGVGAAILGLVSQVAPAEWVAAILLPGLEQMPDPMSLAGLRILLFLGGMAILIGFLTSLVATLLIHWNFTLTRTPTALQVRRGLLTEHRDTVPFRRIQALRVEENWIRRIFGLASVKVVVAGRAGSSQRTGADLILPVGSRRRAFELAREIVGMEPEGAPPLVAMPDHARRRRLLRAFVATVLAAVGGGIAGAWIEAWTPWLTVPFFSLLVLVTGLLLARLSYRGLGWADHDPVLVVREGALTRRWALVPLESVQELRTVSNPFQRRRNLATLELHIARPVGVFGAPRAIDLEDRVAAHLRERWALRLAQGDR
jgi:putative membrane protein